MVPKHSDPEQILADHTNSPPRKSNPPSCIPVEHWPTNARLSSKCSYASEIEYCWAFLKQNRNVKTLRKDPDTSLMRRLFLVYAIRTTPSRYALRHSRASTFKTNNMQKSLIPVRRAKTFEDTWRRQYVRSGVIRTSNIFIASRIQVFCVSLNASLIWFRQCCFIDF